SRLTTVDRCSTYEPTCRNLGRRSSKRGSVKFYGGSWNSGTAARGASPAAADAVGEKVGDLGPVVHHVPHRGMTAASVATSSVRGRLTSGGGSPPRRRRRPRAGAPPA